MFCPECHTEYRPGFTRCADCDVDLVHELPEEGEPDILLVKVFESANPVVLSLAASLLRSADIGFLTRRPDAKDDFHDLAGGTSFNQITGPVAFWVRDDEEQAALDLLAGIDPEATSLELPEEDLLDENGELIAEEDDRGEDEEEQEES